MSEPVVSPILAILALAAVFSSAIIAIGVGAPAAHSLRSTVLRYTNWASFAIAATAMSGSLFYSQVAHFPPCEFCWFQRIAMYPLAVVFLVASITRDTLVRRYVIPIASIGLLLSIYHYQLELFPEQKTVCTSGVPCSVRWVEELGFISIPFMAGCGFLAILLLQLASFRARRYSDTTTP